MSSVLITWVASTSTVDGYNIYRGPAAGQETTKLNTTGVVTGTTFTDSAPVPGEDFYVVRASVSGVESVNSNEVSVTLPPAPPTNVVATLSS